MGRLLEQWNETAREVYFRDRFVVGTQSVPDSASACSPNALLDARAALYQQLAQH
jgi:hypothetical protein